jgi:hypothetical protein
MKIKTLDQKHPTYDLDTWAKCSAIYRGGKEFKSLLSEFLPQNPQENIDVYQKRCEDSYFRSYAGPIVDYYTAWLFSGGMNVRAKDAKDPLKQVAVDPYYSEFQEDCSGDVDLTDFIRERFTTSLIKQTAYTLLEFHSDDGDEPVNLVEYKERGLDRACAICVDPEDVYDWEVDEHGKFLWVIIHCKELVRENPTDERNIIVERWCIYDRTNCEEYEIRYKKNEKPNPETELLPKSITKHRFLEVPLVKLCVPEGMWITGRILDAQVEHFRMSSALGWAIRRTCYAMPVFNIEDEEDPPKMGNGYFIQLGLEEKMSWSAPPATPFDTIGKEVDSQRDEIFRITHQLALGLDNNADTVGRSADSKEMDTAATRVMLNAYGKIVSEAVESIFEILSDARGDTDVFWSVEGFSGYDTATAPQLLACAKQAQELQIPSKVFRREIETKAALALMPEVDQAVKQAIRTEIKEAYDKLKDIEALQIPALREAKLAPRAPDGEAPPVPTAPGGESNKSKGKEFFSPAELDGIKKKFAKQ